MSGRPDDRALDALLAGYVPPAVPAGLVDRVSAAALALPQDGAVAGARVGRDRRGVWLRRPLIAGGAALGLAFSGAVAATYAGLPLPPKVEAVIAQLPLVSSKNRAAPTPAPTRTTTSERHESAPAEPTTARRAEEARPFRAFWQSLSPPERRRLRQAPPARRLFVARRIVEDRRAAGLPTPGADRIEQAIERRRAAATARDAIADERQAERRALRRARIRAEMRARHVVGPAAPFAGGPVDPGANPDMRAGPGPRLEPAWEAGARAERRERRRAIREERRRRFREMHDEGPELPEPPAETGPEPRR